MEHGPDTLSTLQDQFVTVKVEPFACLQTENEMEHVGMGRSNMDYKSDALTTLQDPMNNAIKLEPLDFLETEIKEESDETFEYISSHQNSIQQPERETTFIHKNLKEDLDYNDSSLFQETVPSCSYKQKESAGENKCKQSRSTSKRRNDNKKYNLQENCSNITSEVPIRNKNIMCDICKKQFTLLYNLKEHINSVHNKIRKYACNTCEKKFSQSGNLLIHIKTVHLRLRNPEENEAFVCKICSKVYTTSGSLKHHVNSFHKGIKPFGCKSCGKRFSRVTQLNRHFNSVHKRIKDYICELCGKTFSQMPHLKEHVVSIHKKLKNFACKLCYKSFSTKSGHNNHFKIVHMGIKYECAKCQKEYSGLTILKKHMRSAHVKATV